MRVGCRPGSDGGLGGQLLEKLSLVFEAARNQQCWVTGATPGSVQNGGGGDVEVPGIELRTYSVCAVAPEIFPWSQFTKFYFKKRQPMWV